MGPDLQSGEFSQGERLGRFDCHITSVTKILQAPLQAVLALPGNALSLRTLLDTGGAPLATITGTFFDPGSGITCGNVVQDGRLLTEGCVGSVLRISDDGEVNVRSLEGKLGRHVNWAGTKFAISAGPTLLKRYTQSSGLKLVNRGKGFRQAAGP